jgi:hypothetical protein
MKWPNHRNLRNRPATPSKGRGSGAGADQARFHSERH